MAKQKKIVYPVDKSAPVMFAALYLFLSSSYGPFLIMENYMFLFSIFYAFMLIPIVIFSYLTGKNIAIYCQSGKNRSKAKWIVAIIILNTCFILSIHAIFNKYSGAFSLIDAFTNATLVSVSLFIPGLLASFRKYNVKAIRRTNNSSKTKKVTKRKRNKEEFEEL